MLCLLVWKTQVKEILKTYHRPSNNTIARQSVENYLAWTKKSYPNNNFVIVIIIGNTALPIIPLINRITIIMKP